MTDSLPDPPPRLAELRRRVDEISHSLARLFPLMLDGELTALAESLKSGQLVPILLDDEDRILDGRNRWIALQLAGLEPKTEHVDFVDVPKLVEALNLTRRHLTFDQKAAIAAELANLPRGGDQSTKSPNGVSQADAAKMMDVSTSSVGKAVKIKKTAPEVHQQIKDGSLKLEDGVVLATLPEPERKQRLKSPLGKGIATLKQKNRRKKLLLNGLPIPEMTGNYAKLMHALKALPSLANDLEVMKDRLQEKPLAPSYARALKRAIDALPKLKFEAILEAADAASQVLQPIAAKAIESEPTEELVTSREQ